MEKYYDPSLLKESEIKAVKWDGANFLEIEKMCGKDIAILIDDKLHIMTYRGQCPVPVGHYVLRYSSGSVNHCTGYMLNKLFSSPKTAAEIILGE